jgi:hypothetical protein
MSPRLSTARRRKARTCAVRAGSYGQQRPARAGALNATTAKRASVSFVSIFFSLLGSKARDVVSKPLDVYKL